VCGLRCLLLLLLLLLLFCGSEPACEGALSGNVRFTLLTRSNPDAKSTAITTQSGQFTGACRALGYKE
jgi:hypothetical protein